MASVTPRTSTRTGVTTWRVQFRIAGSMKQESFDNPTAAHEFSRLVDKVGGVRAREVLDARQSSGTGAPTLREFTERYLDPESGIITGIEQGTRSDYRGIAERSFLPMLGDYPLDVIDRTDVGRWVAWQEAQPSTRRKGKLMSSKTVKNYHALLSNILAAAVDADLVPKNVAKGMRLSRGEKEEAVFLSPAEFQTLLHFIPPHYQLLVYFAGSTGLRWGEITALIWSDLTLHGAVPTVRVTKAWKKGPNGGVVLGRPKTGKSIRSVSFHAGLVDALGAPGPGDELIFRGVQSGKRIWYQRFNTSTWGPAVDKAMDRDLCASLGLTPLTRRPTFHDLRHTHASWLIAAGKPLPYIQARLGHESITTTVDVYGHLVPDAHEQLATAIGDTLAGVGIGAVSPTRELEADVILDVEVLEDDEV